MHPITARATWNLIISALPGAHILQTWEWGEFKSLYGWSPARYVWHDPKGQTIAAAQVLKRQLPRLPVCILYAPKGPLLAWDNESLRARVLADLADLARRERAIFIKIDPPLPPSPPNETTSTQNIVAAMRGARGGWILSASQIQFRNTVVLDLTRPEAQILATMKQKTRYNIRLAERKGVRVRTGTLADLDVLYQLYAETSVRDGFVIRHADYYRDAWGSFIRADLAQPFIAEVEGQAVSALILFKFARTAWYMYGMSREAHRDKMPNHLLQWEAMRWAKARGCATYDFWGAPDEFVETDPLWGVWKFKEGFGGEVRASVGAVDFAPNRAVYWLYTVIMPRILNVMRQRGRQQTRAALE